ncbi:cAMP-dependent protein kinase inhibitor gamma isoform X1 [Mauremys reevesii]|uniref:cAMP-dependent protein kinase inhibitor gamma isoform X1 n=1 Tax=Mauremys reevesii TaxID=260615 RepID=UPI00193F9701|nr:cAMP-dependent protein kinase inhibitor gamma isoform X1 [Mauremys reevesii]XP_039354625.1 cAMP-dependent protein kinase inhibitor gamma isoform X1 [Mauremys reevesii]XP_039354626.1 cAMP-dependent protein kinase inhibitor gamma isoform X1 [Mauremys reevesii]XP_039354627.1 cAMP-dependent protein kinase inhibitor gamma isoform X1 [Mauremys reevesii]XP_039354628.1 cAMP-dependent protein kinase inhibitor gamma isoform X1 [Mauremys reevesii]
MSNPEKRKGNPLKKCLKCQVELGRASFSMQGLCPHCNAKAGEDQKNQKGKRDSYAFGNASEVMEIEPSYTDFISCDRTGRRNAIHDIQGDTTSISMRKLAGDIGELSIEGAGNQAAAAGSEKEPEARLEGQDGTAPS